MDNLANMEFSVEYTIYPPFIGLKEHGSTTTMKGVDFYLLIELSRQLNFTFRLINLTDNWYERLMANQSLVDIIIGGFHLNYERSKLYKNLYPYFMDQTSIMTRQSKNHESYQHDRLLDPFDDYIWLAILFSLILLPLWTLITVHCNSINSDSILDSCSIWLYILLKQNVLSRLKRESSPTIIVSAVWIWATFMLSNFYAGCLLSMISIPINNRIDSLQELSDYCQQEKNMVVLMENNTTTMKIVHMMADKPLFAPMIAHEQLVDQQTEAISLILDESMAKMNGKSYAFLQYYTILKIIQQSFSPIKHRLHVAKASEQSSIHTSPTCFLFRSQFSYVRQFDRITIQLFSSVNDLFSSVHDGHGHGHIGGNC
ncbi:hypothetical protein HUG17_4065 [Dermatophagoides farinae]|uniref:Solute-binding protein family 3/N-terminal domain-containing protein n=1 Tax=Dermatophagoides farinae TaxID=6954 RepID=A0A9D4NXX6_DERFA|nr:hypothetical protein HUG17_4065 [Dermatophagoides farinae]